MLVEHLVYMFPVRDNDEAALVQHLDGRVFVTLVEAIRPYAHEADEDAMPAFNRAFNHAPHLFRQVEKPSVAVEPAIETPGMIKDLTPRDRARLRAIVLKHANFYFAHQPSMRDVDQLIDALGVEVAMKQVKKHVDKGLIQ